MGSSSSIRHTIGLVALLSAVAVWADEAPTRTTDPVAASMPKPAAPPTQDLLCRDRLRPGSHIKMRTCLTAEQWVAANRQPVPFADFGSNAGAWQAGGIGYAGGSTAGAAFPAGDSGAAGSKP